MELADPAERAGSMAASIHFDGRHIINASPLVAQVSLL
jgi:hypothetical protein